MLRTTSTLRVGGRALRAGRPMPKTSSAGAGVRVPCRAYNFGSAQYVAAFGDVPPVDVAQLRADTLSALEAFDGSSWHTDPLRTRVGGRALACAQHMDVSVDTSDAFEVVNGRQVQASEHVVGEVIAHLTGYTPPTTDLRTPVRLIEAELLSTHAATLVANQAMDFCKQDGVTEIEESLEANAIERRFNDQLLADEQQGVVAVGRHVAFVGCVSNFSNFLDLCRKTLRNLEVGVPCCVLSRTNTSQHMYRWFQLLEAQLAVHGVDPGMLTFVSADIPAQRRVMAACADSPLYLTGSREVAQAIKDLLPNTFSSTGGPNTMVATQLSPAVAAAVRTSATIENSGQCTALRHVVVPGLGEAGEVGELLKGPYQRVTSSADSLSQGEFCALMGPAWAQSFQGAVAPGYHTVQADAQEGGGEAAPVAYTLRTGDALPPYSIEEHWRRVYVDVSSPADAKQLHSSEFISTLAKWLVTTQPITLSINGDDPQQGFPLATQLFEQTAQVVYSVGSLDEPALSCQARPQDGEIFGEFPPRKQLSQYTKAPVFVPSPTAACNTAYTAQHLEHLGGAGGGQGPLDIGWLTSLLAPESVRVRGYCQVLAAYLHEAARGPNHGHGSRTTLWGLQTPPRAPAGDAAGTTVLRLGADGMGALDEAAAHVLCFALTNAAEQLVLSYHPENTSMAQLASACPPALAPCTLLPQSDAAFDASAEGAWNVLTPCLQEGGEFLLAGQFVSLLFPLGHIKSTMTPGSVDDAAFKEAFGSSPKWLRVRDEY